MPVNNFQQARIDMSKAQAKAVGELLMHTMGAAVSIEETNIPNCVAVIKGGSAIMLVHHGGEVHKIGGLTAKAVREPSRRKSSRTK